MGRKRRESIDKGEGRVPSDGEGPTDDLFEQIRRLEEEKERVEDEKRRLQEEKERLEEEIRRIERENEIFRKILDTKGIDADRAIVEFISKDGESILEELRELRRRAGMNSGNSSLPPSSDRPWLKPKKRSLRPETGRKSGGQAGHPGSTIRLPRRADRIVMLYPAGCENCPKREECESGGAFTCAETRSVVDLKVETTVTEFRALRRNPCRFAGSDRDTGVFPENVRAFAQYGDGVAVLTGILDTYGAMSDKRIAEVINGMSGLEMASSTVVAMVQRCAEKVAPAMGPIADAVAAGPVTNCDETGTRAVVEVRKKDGGSDGADGLGTETVSRNVWIHGESKSVIENMPGHGWARMFIDLLLEMKEAKEEAVAAGADSLPDDVLEGFHRRYSEIMDTADAECPPPPPPTEKRRGRRKKGKERALIERLREREAEICLFAGDFSAPFDNNLAERAFRFVKTKTKVSGCFRSTACLQQYLDIMSYIDTARKHGISAFKALLMAFEGRWAEAIGPSARSGIGSDAGRLRYLLSSYEKSKIVNSGKHSRILPESYHSISERS